MEKNFAKIFGEIDNFRNELKEDIHLGKSKSLKNQNQTNMDCQ